MRVKLEIPTDLSEVKLHQYQKYLKIQENNSDDTFLASKMIEVFCGLDLKDAFKMKATDVYRITAILAEMFEQKPKLVQRFTMDGVEYGFIPNLDDMSLGEYIDLDTHLSDWQNMHLAMAVLYRPIKQKLKHKYLIADYEAKNQEKMKNMPMDAVLGSMVFFYRLGSKLPSYTLDYLQTELKGKEIPPQLKQALEKSGVGINQYLQSLKKMQQRLTKLQNYQYIPV